MYMHMHTCGFSPLMVEELLEFPIPELLALGITNKISPHSYTDGTHAYLA